MKKLALLGSILLLSFSACKEEGNKVVMDKDGTENVVDNENTLFDETNSYGYIASDASRANVTYQNEGNTHTITIKANNAKYVLDKKDGDADSQMYERNGVEAKVTSDSLFITQDDMVISLKLIK